MPRKRGNNKANRAGGGSSATPSGSSTSNSALSAAASSTATQGPSERTASTSNRNARSARNGPARANGSSSVGTVVGSAAPTWGAPQNKKKGGKGKEPVVRDCSRLVIRQIQLGEPGIEKYDIVLSRAALKGRNFHHAVANLTRAEIIDNYGNLVNRYTTLRPSVQEYVAGVKYKNQIVSQSRSLTRCFLIFRDSLMSGRFDADQNEEWDREENKLAQVLNTVDIGGLVAQTMFASGYRAILSAATTSTQSWSAITHSSKIWDFFAGDFHTNGPANVFIAVSPEYTLGEIRRAIAADPYRFSADNSSTGWFFEAADVEQEIYLSIQTLHRRLTANPNLKLQLGAQSDEIAHYIPMVVDVDRIPRRSPLACATAVQVFRSSANFDLNRLQAMRKSPPRPAEAFHPLPQSKEANLHPVNKILSQANILKVLHFHKTPLLDRRLLAIILRACPGVEMLGVYDCPLIHFGDILCLLDLVHEVNRDRRANGKPLIKALDFYPSFHEGCPYVNTWAETYGISWGALPVEIVQRGSFCIVLKAFMKAHAMKLDLLFSKEGSLLSFLFKLPQYFLAMATFLDACHRLVDLPKRRRKRNNDNARRQAIYDLLKPVRVGLENVKNDWPTYYINNMAETFVFCSSCGYEVVEEFFTTSSMRDRPHSRYCSGCILQFKLDEDPGQLRCEKRGILTTLFPDWKKQEHNFDAPLAGPGSGLIKLKTTKTVRKPAPSVITVNGMMVGVDAPQELELVRDSKLPDDSLQNLPSLSDLLKGPASKQTWSVARHEANGLDLYSRLLWSLRFSGATMPTEEGEEQVAVTRFDGALPDHIHERQPPNYGHNFDPCRTMSSVLAMGRRGLYDGM
ncbi:Metallo-dependent phosphatase [Purpureocillium lavendulum]|uniref:Metallo-dependent phosphatase n=1 Tax=Purpureocillium lavendulum TaxID=1247861 RepID=A0AB34FV05_9HYPO|nr:Metallo-dependent phosphatase [Purpureocillium lavendulum]